MLKSIAYKSFLTISIVFCVLFFNGSAPPDEGMYPLSEISKLDLKNAGLKIDIKEIYNSNGVSLIDALVRVGGCTGSFISSEGLILTNHHCAYDYVSDASTVENNYLENGFLAKTKSEEIPAVGLTCLITESYLDVSDEILKAAANAKDISERTKAIQKKSKELILNEESKDSTIKAEVSEMFIGKTYILFKYRVIKDVRLVFIPPKSIGNFGGETDNWVWPKHTGDFSFLRAYGGKDGSALSYSIENVPYKPKKFLKVNPNGAEEEDFIFILGYPGRTFRHQPSQFVDFHENYQLPYIVDIYSWLMNKYETLGKADPELELKLSPKIKSLANTQKNYLGKLKGLNRLSLVDKKKSEEIELQKFINSDLKLKEEYGNLLSDIDEVYKKFFSLGRMNLVYNQLINNCPIITLGDILCDYRTEILKPDTERKSLYQEKNKGGLINRIESAFEVFSEEANRDILNKMLGDAVGFKEFENFKPFSKFLKENNPKSAVKQFVDELIEESDVQDYRSFNVLLSDSENGDDILDDPLIKFVSELKSEFAIIQKQYDEINGKLNLLLAKLLDAKKLWQQKIFIPDANSTLRLTFGYIRGYTPADAVYYKPITTLKGVIDKSFSGGDYQIPPKVKELYDKKDFGRWVNKNLNDIPVALLYNTDTTGGNSGSPILNAYGELIGVNFDRSFEATINDYAWSESYSRSIGVDIRYVLWVTEKIGEAGYLIQEMGI
jgi:hypothetical protein